MMKLNRRQLRKLIQEAISRTNESKITYNDKELEVLKDDRKVTDEHSPCADAKKYMYSPPRETLSGSNYIPVWKCRLDTRIYKKGPVTKESFDRSPFDD